MLVIQSIAVVGAGAMGAMYAVHLADAGFDVSFVATGERAERLRRDGIVVNGVRRSFPVIDPHPSGPDRRTDPAAPLDPARPPEAAPTADLETPSDPVDLLVVAVKADHLAESIELLAPLVTPHTTILSVLNGLDSEQALAARFADEQVVLSMAAGMETQRIDGAVRFRRVGRFSIGVNPALPAEAQARQQARVTALTDVFDRSGLAWQIPPDIRHAMWWKFMVNVGVNLASAVLRAPYGAFKIDGPARDLSRALMLEVVAVGRLEGITLTDADLAQWDAVLAGQPDDGWTSTLQDVHAGRPTEVEMFAGRVVALGRHHGIPTPVNQAVLWILRDHAERVVGQGAG